MNVLQPVNEPIEKLMVNLTPAEKVSFVYGTMTKNLQWMTTLKKWKREQEWTSWVRWNWYWCYLACGEPSDVVEGETGYSEGLPKVSVYQESYISRIFWGGYGAQFNFNSCNEFISDIKKVNFTLIHLLVYDNIGRGKRVEFAIGDMDTPPVKPTLLEDETKVGAFSVLENERNLLPDMNYLLQLIADQVNISTVGAALQNIRPEQPSDFKYITQLEWNHNGGKTTRVSIGKKSFERIVWQ